MSIPIASQSIGELAPITPQSSATPASSGGFGQVLDDVSSILEKADQLAMNYAQGKAGLTEAVLAANQADAAFQLVVGVRNRALAAYQEITSLQV